MVKKICVVTGSRAEYGLLSTLMKHLQQDQAFELQIVAGAMHLSPEYGLTYQKILDEGFHINEKVEMLLSSDTAVGVGKSLGLGVISFADVFARLKPDLVVLLGDRFETLAAAQAALIASIPIAHIHGGEVTMGAYDDAIRHSITKMAHLHFVSTQIYKQRVIQLGEAPEQVHHVGAMVLDSILNMTFVERKELEKLLRIKFNRHVFVITYQPETVMMQDMAQDFRMVLDALDTFEDATFIFTKGNADKNCRVIYEMMDAFSEKYPDKAKTFTQLGHENYLKLVRVVDAVVGNSSSGIIEAPFFKTPTVNIGTRQHGRVRSSSIIDCAVNKEEIVKAIALALSEPFKASLQNMTYPYGEGSPSQKIVQILSTIDFKKTINKQFYDLLPTAGK